MKTLFLHIGTPKTATTSIQHFCDDNQERLNQRSYCYPDYSYTYTNVGKLRNAHFLFGRLFDENGERKYEKEDAIFDEGMNRLSELFETYDNVILSDEGIWHYGLQDDEKMWKKLKEESQKKKFSVKVIGYFRRQDEFLFSWWSQQIKEGMHPSSVLTWEQMYTELDFIQTFYYENLERIASYVGKENICVRIFDRSKFIGGSIYADFMDAIGLEFTEEYKITKEVQNISLSKDANGIKRVLNTLPDLDADSNNLFRKLLVEISGEYPDDKTQSMFSKEEYYEFMSHYEEGNRRLAKEYLGTEEALFDLDFGDKTKWNLNSSEGEETLVRFAGRVMQHFEVENAALKKEAKEQKQQLRDLRYKINHPLKTVGNRLKK